MRIRNTLVALLAMSSLLVAPVAAGAASTTTPGSTVTHTKSLTNVPVTGKAHNGKPFKGNLKITQFVSRGGQTYVLGTLSGKLGNRTVKAQQVALPTKLPSGNKAGAAATCPILHLTLGPLDLHLLGLNVHLNQVVVTITATSGPGNLLGNLLCGIANLLNQGSVVGTNVASLLNIVSQLLNNPGLMNL